MAFWWVVGVQTWQCGYFLDLWYFSNFSLNVIISLPLSICTSFLQKLKPFIRVVVVIGRHQISYLQQQKHSGGIGGINSTITLPIGSPLFPSFIKGVDALTCLHSGWKRLLPIWFWKLNCCVTLVRVFLVFVLFFFITKQTVTWYLSLMTF